MLNIITMVLVSGSRKQERYECYCAGFADRRRARAKEIKADSRSWKDKKADSPLKRPEECSPDSS